MRGGYDIEPYSIFQGEEDEVLLERPERVFEDESIIDEGEFIVVVSHRMVVTPGTLTKVFGEGHK